ncbi:hypothetical protein M885DRAFT_500608 [Pelagophyceae sp. CCMP2097]|nr:hypothetical protein M885DRAFT_500608 [Pelagophyceae sp. CCMP2097]
MRAWPQVRRGAFPRLLRAVLRCVDDGESRFDVEHVALGMLETSGEDFSRYADGALRSDAFVAMALFLGGAVDAFHAAAAAQSGLAGGTMPRGLGVFRRLDVARRGHVRLEDFLVGVGRLLHPVAWDAHVSAVSGWPGWPALGRSGSRSKVCEMVQSLQTGDLILTRIDDSLGRLLQFALDTPWNHAAVVLRLDADMAGESNGKTEELLEKFPFRRATHVSCAPASCECFPHGATTASRLRCPGVFLLEATSEGVHVYDLAHRLLQSAWSAQFAAVAVRRLTAGRDAEKAAAFARNVRGCLFSTTPNQFRDGIAWQLSDKGEARGCEACAGDARRSRTCSQLVTELYQHMGWIDTCEDASMVMPSAFAGEVALVGGAALGPLEVVWTPQIGELPWHGATDA